MSKIVFVFPGQGAQAVGMGRDLYENSPAARAAFEAVDAACGFAVSTLCFEGPEETLKETRNTQPCLFATSVAALAAAREAGLEPQGSVGHSIGEYAALVAAEVFSMETGARLVKARAEAMADAAADNPGAMAAVLGLDPDPVIAACAEITASGAGVVVAANLNSPGQVVVSGETGGVEAVSVLLKERGAKRVVPLAVSGAFHSPLMESAAVRMRQTLHQYVGDFADPAIPVVANVTAAYEGNVAEVVENLAAQVAGPVRWVESTRRLYEDGYTIFVECGPGNVLTGLIKRIAPEATLYNINDMASLKATVEAVEALTQ